MDETSISYDHFRFKLSRDGQIHTRNKAAILVLWFFSPSRYMGKHIYIIETLSILIYKAMSSFKGVICHFKTHTTCSKEDERIKLTS